jgi:hypothetical protein
MSSRLGFVVVVAIVLAGCVDTSSNTDLVESGPPEIAQVLLSEDQVSSTGGQTTPEVFAFGTLPAADPSIEHAVTTAAPVGQELRVIVDQLLRGNRLEQILCRDNVVVDPDGALSPWSDVPDEATPDDIARCAVSTAALPQSCVGPNATCICQIPGGCGSVANGAPVGIVDDNADGAADTTQLKPGSVRIVCGHGADRSIEVPLSGQVSYYNPSGNQLVPAKGGFDALGPQLHLIPANPNTLPISDSQGHPLQLVKALPTNTTCGLAFDMSVVDKANLQVCAVPGGRPASCVGRLADCPQFQQGCMPGDVSAFSFGVDGMTLSASVVDGQQNVSLTQPIFVTSNVPFDQNNIQNITLSPAPSGLAISLGTPNVSQIQVSFGMAGLAPLTMYTLTVPTTVTDSFEQPPPAPLVIHFTTAAM